MGGVVKGDESSRYVFIYTMNRVNVRGRIIYSCFVLAVYITFCNLLYKSYKLLYKCYIIYLAISRSEQQDTPNYLTCISKGRSFDGILLFAFMSLCERSDSLKTWILKGGKERGEKHANAFRNRCFRKSRCFTARTSGLNSHKWAAASSN